MLTFHDYPELCSSWRSHHVGRVLHVAEEGAVIAELSRTQLYGDVPLVYVSDKLHPVFELIHAEESFPVWVVENLEEEKKKDIQIIQVGILLKLKEVSQCLFHTLNAVFVRVKCEAETSLNQGLQQLNVCLCLALQSLSYFFHDSCIRTELKKMWMPENDSNKPLSSFWIFQTEELTSQGEQPNLKATLTSGHSA